MSRSPPPRVTTSIRVRYSRRYRDQWPAPSGCLRGSRCGGNKQPGGGFPFPSPWRRPEDFCIKIHVDRSRGCNPFNTLPEVASMKGNEKLLGTLNSLLSDELTAISQYMVLRKCAQLGYEKLHKYFEKRAVDEMKHAEKLIGRILFLEEHRCQQLGRMSIGADASKQLASDHRARVGCNPGLQSSHQASRRSQRFCYTGRYWKTFSRMRIHISTGSRSCRTR